MDPPDKKRKKYKPKQTQPTIPGQGNNTSSNDTQKQLFKQKEQNGSKKEEKREEVKKLNKNQPHKIEENKNFKPKYAEKNKKKVFQISSDGFGSVSERIDDIDLRKLKKYFLQIFSKAKGVIVKYQIDKPEIIYEFFEDGRKEVLPLKQILKANNHLKKDKILIKMMYGTLYHKVTEKYYDILKFGLEVVQERRIYFKMETFKSTAKSKLITEYPIYFGLKGENFNFILFDQFNNFVQFSSFNIRKLKNQLRPQFQVYEQFQRVHIKNLQAQELVAETFGQQQVDSDEEEKAKRIAQQKHYGAQELRDKIIKIVKRDIEQYQNSIDQKDAQVQRLNNSNSDNQRVLKLSDEVMEEQTSLDNFTQTRDDVISKMDKKMINSQQETQMLKACLKRMILAEKQLISRLPIISRKREIFEKLDKNNLLILEGETGSGKSTQLPQLLCEYYRVFEREDALPVLITQPRKLATRTLAERVASEMEETVHGFVDYQTSLTSKVNEKAKIVFKMDRLVLDELKVDPKLSKYCCLVIDEAHERTISIDVILGLIKNLLTLRKDFKIIVTSASMDTELFRRYFKTEILKVSGRMYPVQEIFQPYDHEKDKTKKIRRIIDQKLLDDNQRNLRAQYRGHVLVFCSGVDQITDLTAYFKNKLNPTVFKVFALHGRLSPQEQRDVFTNCQEHKIIFSTRIAETSITIDKIRVVIDPGEDRQLVYDQKSKVSTMKLRNICQSSAKQRAGRAGRTNQGYCFRLYSKVEKNKFNTNKIPEIQNMALDTVVLRLKSLEIEDIINFPYLSPPSKQGLLNSIQIMKMLNCLDERTSKITPIGDFLVKIPIEPFLARSIVQAMIIQKVIHKRSQFPLSKVNPKLLDDLVSIDMVSQTIRILCMVVNASNLFFVRPEEREMAEKVKFQKLADQSGDFFYFRYIYSQFIRLFEEKDNKRLRNWVNDHYLSIKTLHQVRELEKQIKQIIKAYSIHEQSLQKEMIEGSAKLLQAKSVREILLSCLVSSFATNLALYSGNEQLGYTIVSLDITMQIYGTSILSLQGISPKWILYYDLYQNEKGQMYCKVAHEIDFNFLINNTNPYITNKFNIREANKFNPFYEKKSLVVPSLIFLHIMNDYQRKNFQDSKDLQFLRQFSINFYEDRNEVQFYYRRKKSKLDFLSNSIIFKSIKQSMNSVLKLSNFRDLTDPQDILAGYFNQISEKYTNSLRYNFVGPIFIQLHNGFKLANVEFKVCEHTFTIKCSQEIAFFIILYCKHFGQYQRYSDTVVWKIVDENQYDPFKRTLDTLLQSIRINNGLSIKYTDEISDRRKKIPQAKLFLYFWTGESARDNIYLQYNNNQTYQKLDDKDKATWLQRIVTQIQNRKRGQMNHRNDRLSRCNFALAKNKRGINCFYREEMDEIQLFQILQEYERLNIFGYNFPMPTYITKFRQPDLVVSNYDEKYWEKKILDILKEVGIKEDKATVKAWGKSVRQKKGQKLSNFEKNLKIQWHAQIKSFDLRQLRLIKQKYNKKTSILGTQRVHLKFQFQQIITSVSQRAFRALQDQYQDVVQKVKIQNPRVTVEYYQRTVRKVTKIYIKIRGQNRDQLIGPSLKFYNLFTPKVIRLPETKFRFLQKFDEGNQILQDLESQYRYRIYFAFNKRELDLKVYCHDAYFKQIFESLDKKMQTYTIFQKQISYRGKNLNRVKEILQKKIQEVYDMNSKDKFLNYDILFKFRKVRITGDVKSCDEVENEIMKIINKQKDECQICCALIQRPYKLFACKHDFCWTCLSSYIRQSITNLSQQLLKCPKCDEGISVYDVQKIVREDEFNKLCDIQISRHVQKNPIYHSCLSPNCQNIFLKEESKANGNYECDLCGKWYCFKCNQSHKGYSCEQWKYKLNDSELTKMGIKKCPKCGEGIQKNEGCQHMTCIKCKAHICWKCLKYFDTSKQCYDHLAKQCGGIMV